MAGRIIENLRRAAGLSPLDWYYVTIAVRELFSARIRHATVPIGDILRELQGQRRSYQAARFGEIDLARLSWALAAAAARVPWRSDCLLTVMAADRWLRRNRHKPEFFLGVAKDATGQLKAHAWLCCGDVTVTGGWGEEFIQLMGTPASDTRARREIAATASGEYFGVRDERQS